MPPQADIFIAEPGGASAAVDGVHSVCVRGAIHCRAVVPPTATVGEAEAAIKEDVERTISARCRILGDALPAGKGDAVFLPARVLCALAGDALLASDYMLDGETPAVRRKERLLRRAWLY